jgi:vancomycin resistance protein VanJ
MFSRVQHFLPRRVTPVTARASDDPQPSAPQPNRQSKLRRRLARVLTITCWLYLSLALVVWLLLRLTGDRWWVGTLLLFGPRWPWALPLIVLGPAALFVRRRWVWAPLLCAAWVVVVPVMGLCLPWRAAIAAGGGGGARLRVLTCNLHRNQTSGKALADVIAAADPDVIVLQDWSSRLAPGIVGVPRPHAIRDDEFCVISRYPVRRTDDLTRLWPGHYGAAVCYDIDAPGGTFPLIVVHLASPHRQFRAVLSGEPEGPERAEGNSDVRRAQSNTVAAYARARGPATIIAGDFNTPDDSGIFREAWTSDFADAFQTAGWGFGWTYRVRLTSARIDHVLAGGAWNCRRCWVGPPVGSPHRPVIADLQRIQ